MNKKLWYLAAGYALTVAFSLSLQFLPPIIPVMKSRLDMTAGQAGTLMSSLALLGIAVSPLVGYLADRWGGRLIGLLGLTGLLLAECWFALSTSYTSLLCARLVMGVGSATLSILGAQIISENFAETKYLGAAMGTMNTAVPMGILISQLVFSRLAVARGWQAPIWLCVVFTAVVTVAYLFLYRNPKPAETTHVSLIVGLRRLSPEVWKLGLVWMFWEAGSLVLLTFGNDLLVSRGMSPQTAGSMAATLMFFPIVASTFMGHLLDRKRWQARGMVLACLMFAVLAVLLGVFRNGALPLFLAVSFTFALAPAGVFGLAPYLMHGRESGLGYGVLAGMLNIGALAGPMMGGIVHDMTGSYLASFIMAGALTCLGAMCVAFLRRPSAEDA